MANLIQLSDDLEFVNKDELIQMSQDPNSRYPSYLVLAEIKRRTMNEKAYAAQQPRPETTVSEEVIQEFAGPQGLGAMAQSSGSNAFPPSDMGNMAPPSGLGGMPSPEMPMQMMAGGGLTGYAEGGRTGYQVGGGLNLGNRDSLSETFANPMENQLSNEELQQILEARNVLPRNEDGSFDKSAIAKAVASGLITATAAAAFLIPEPTTSAFGAAGKMSNLGDRAFSIIGGSGNNIRLNPTEEKLYIQLANEMIDKKAGGGRTGYQVGGFTPTAENPYPTAYSTGTPASTGLSGTQLTSDTFTESPQTKFGAAGKKIFELGSDVANWAMENPADAAITGLMFVPGIGWAGSLGLKAISAISKASKGKNLLKSAFMTPGSPGYTSITAEGVKKVVPKVADKYSALRTQGTSLGIFGGKEVYDYGMSPAEEQPEPLSQDEIIKQKVAEEMAKFTKNTTTDVIDKEIETNDKKGLANFLPNADPSMLIGLGGAIMSANTIGDLGKGISNVALGERARKDALQISGLKSRLTEAQINKFEADVANMSAQQIVSEMNAINKSVESGAIQIDEELQAYMSSLRARLSSMRSESGTGFAASEAPTGGDILDRNRVA